MCDGRLARRQLGEKKDLTKALLSEERRQKAENVFPDLEKFRSVSLKHTKPGRDRAISLAQDDARLCRPRQRNQFVQAFSRASSTVLFRTKNSPKAQRRKSIG